MEPKELIVSLPLVLDQSKKKKFYLNLNVYRNAHFLVLNNMKIKFKNQIKKELDIIPVMKSVMISYQLFPGTNRLSDVANVCSIVDKFFSDALVESGKLEDDDYTFLSAVEYRIGSVDKSNPRVEATLYYFEP